MNINQLKYFQTVCEFNNITKAAEKLHISQPSVSSAVKDLEQELRVALLKRDKNKIALTPTGEFFLTQITKILSAIDDLPRETRAFDEENKAALKIGISEFGSSIYLKALPFINAFYSDRKLITYEGAGSEVIRRIEEGALEFGIVVLDDDITLKYNYKNIDEFEICYCINPENPYAAKDRVSFAEIRKNPLIWFLPEPAMSNILMVEYKKYECRPNKMFSTTRMLVVEDILDRDKVIGTFMIKEALAGQTDVAAIPLVESLKLRLGVIWKKDHEMPPAIDDFPEIVWGSYHRKIEKYFYKVIT